MKEEEAKASVAETLVVVNGGGGQRSGNSCNGGAKAVVVVVEISKEGVRELWRWGGRDGEDGSCGTGDGGARVAQAGKRHRWW